MILLFTAVHHCAHNKSRGNHCALPAGTATLEKHIKFKMQNSKYK